MPENASIPLYVVRLTAMSNSLHTWSGVTSTVRLHNVSVLEPILVRLQQTQKDPRGRCAATRDIAVLPRCPWQSASVTVWSASSGQVGTAAESILTWSIKTLNNITFRKKSRKLPSAQNSTTIIGLGASQQPRSEATFSCEPAPCMTLTSRLKRCGAAAGGCWM